MNSTLTPSADSENTAAQEAGEASRLQKTEIERLGRQRPEVFLTAVSEILFCSSMLLSTLMAEVFTSGFNIILPTISVELNIPASAQTWPTSVFSLTAGALLLPLGRLTDIHGGFVVYFFGLVWFLIWSIVVGFSTNYEMLIVSRALQGLGPSAFLPAGLMLLGKTYRPGPRKNLVFSLYGAFAPIGFYTGIILAGATADYISWRWYQWIGSAVIFIICVTSVFCVPRDWKPRSESGLKLDWYGTVTVVPALVLIVFAITDGVHAPDGWRTPYIIATFILGVLLFAAFVYVEGWVSSQPLLPLEIFKPKYMKPLSLSLFFAYGVFGIFLYYASFYLSKIMGYSTIHAALAFTPMAAGGVLIATVGGFTMHLLPGRVILIFSGVGALASVLLFALVPDGGSYWAWVLPSMIGATIGIDITYNVTNVFITTQVPQRLQGAAGALINSLLYVSTSFLLGMADLVAASYADRGARQSYKAVFWFATGCAAFSLAWFLYIDVGKQESQLTVEEMEELQSQQAPMVVDSDSEARPQEPKAVSSP